MLPPSGRPERTWCLCAAFPARRAGGVCLCVLQGAFSCSSPKLSTTANATHTHRAYHAQSVSILQDKGLRRKGEAHLLTFTSLRMYFFGLNLDSPVFAAKTPTKTPKSETWQNVLRSLRLQPCCRLSPPTTRPPPSYLQPPRTWRPRSAPAARAPSSALPACR